MSRIGKHAILLPNSVNVSVLDQIVSIKGPLGEDTITIPAVLEVINDNNSLKVLPRDNQMSTKALWGTCQKLLANAVSGSVTAFEKRVELVGVGFKAAVEGKTLVMQLGYSHEVRYEIPKSIQVICEKPTLLLIKSSYKQILGEFVSNLCTLRPAEPYKGKGVLLVGKFVRRKEGKKK